MNVLSDRKAENGQRFVKSLGRMTKLEKRLVNRLEADCTSGNVAYTHGKGFVLN